jgi:hypothetical protein
MHTTTAAWRAEQRDLAIAAAVTALTDSDGLASGPYRLHSLTTAVHEAERAIRMEVALARGVGIGWAEIGAGLGVTKQAAQQRYGAVSIQRSRAA